VVDFGHHESLQLFIRINADEWKEGKKLASKELMFGQVIRDDVIDESFLKVKEIKRR